MKKIRYPFVREFNSLSSELRRNVISSRWKSEPYQILWYQIFVLQLPTNTAAPYWVSLETTAFFRMTILMPFLVLLFLSGELIISGPWHLKLIPLSSQRQMNRIPILTSCSLFMPGTARLGLGCAWCCCGCCTHGHRRCLAGWLLQQSPVKCVVVLMI